MNARIDVFQAIANPARHRITGLVAQKLVNINTVAEPFNISRQAVSLFVKTLEA